jgi:undecaprenyl-diphosphatase
MDFDFIQVVGYLILGIIQGLAEVFPISSSAHLAMLGDVLERTLGFKGFGFEAAVFLHIGTFTSIILFYQRDVIRLWQALVSSVILGMLLAIRSRSVRVIITPSDTDAKLAMNMVASLFVTAIVGLSFQKLANGVFYDTSAMAGLLVVNGLIILVVAQFAPGKKRMEDIQRQDYLLIGLAQGIAVFPGISRFGMTLCAALWRGLSWYQALKLSFLLSLPTVVGATLVEGVRYLERSYQVDLLGLVLGTVVSGVVCYYSIRWLLAHSLHNKHKLAYFGVYCIVVGAYASVYFGFLY